jgi:hypothetical protein
MSRSNQAQAVLVDLITGMENFPRTSDGIAGPNLMLPFPKKQARLAANNLRFSNTTKK